MTYEEMLEKVARAWAVMDGKADEFDKCKADPQYDMEHGYFVGYIEDAKELLKCSDMEKMLKVVSKVITHMNAEKNGAYFITGEGGEKNEVGMPKYVYICPTFGLDWFYAYERTDRTYGPEW